VKRVAVLASGRGSNLAALIAAQSTFDSYRVVLVVSNLAGSGALALARDAGIESVWASSRGLAREDHERAIVDLLKQRSIEVVCLAGYMRVLTTTFLAGFSGPILNIHPSLLPAFPGIRAQEQALSAGVKWSGATVHFVDDGLDTGPIILQEPVPVRPDDTESTLSGRILEVEHRLFPRALDIVARDRFEIRGRVVHLPHVEA
jgi:phosphoribosylglycinamide formyltransferase-1